MPKDKIPKTDLTGGKFYMLKPIEYIGGSKWKCVCDCGNTTIVKTSNLTNGHTRSCGCLSKKQSAANGQKSIMDLTGQRFGKLVVKKYVGKSTWECECDCGNICYVAQNNLCREGRGTKSCGCLVNLKNANKTNIVRGTNVGFIRSTKPTSRSTTGVKGVFFTKSTGRYTAHIRFQGKWYYLVSSKDMSVCVAARKEAEENIYGEFLQWYEKYRAKQKFKSCKNKIKVARYAKKIQDRFENGFASVFSGLMTNNKMTPEEIAEKIDVDCKTIYAYSYGDILPSFGALCKMYRLFGEDVLCNLPEIGCLLKRKNLGMSDTSDNVFKKLRLAHGYKLNETSEILGYKGYQSLYWGETYPYDKIKPTRYVKFICLYGWKEIFEELQISPTKKPSRT